MEDLHKKLPWFYRAPRWQVFLACVLVGGLVFLLAFGLEFWFYRIGSQPMHMILASDVFAAILSTIVQFITISYLRQRREYVIRTVRVIADMNHHIRNALEGIQGAEALRSDTDRAKIVRQSVERITWALDEILGREYEQEISDYHLRKKIG